MDKICSERGTISDDGDKIVDKYSGYFIQHRNFENIITYEKSGKQIISHEILDLSIEEKRKEEDENILKEDKAEYKTETAKQIDNILKTLDVNIGVDTKKYHTLIIRIIKLQIDEKLSSVKAYNIKTTLSDEKSIGDDRLINVVYGKHLFSSSLMIIDFGTATTIDVINEIGIYDGGVITPGIDLSLLSLKQCTAKLPLVKFQKTKNIVGKNTLEAIQSGFFWGYISMIQGLVKKIEQNQKVKFGLILTGGNSILFKGCFQNVIKIDEFFNSKGLNFLINNLLSQE